MACYSSWGNTFIGIPLLILLFTHFRLPVLFWVVLRNCQMGPAKKRNELGSIRPMGMGHQGFPWRIHLPVMCYCTRLSCMGFSPVWLQACRSKTISLLTILQSVLSWPSTGMVGFAWKSFVNDCPKFLWKVLSGFLKFYRCKVFQISLRSLLHRAFENLQTRF